jgi:hypothetical protein
VTVQAAAQMISRATVELASRLGHCRHADDQLARLLLAHLELLGTLLVLLGAVAELADERLDGEADNRGNADPEQRVRPLARRILGRPGDEDGEDEDCADAGDAERELLPRSIQREPEDREHHEHGIGRDASAVGLAEQCDDEEVRQRRRNLREVRQATPGDGDRAEDDQRVEDHRRDEHRGGLHLGWQREGHDREPHGTQERGRARE